MWIAPGAQLIIILFVNVLRAFAHTHEYIDDRVQDYLVKYGYLPKTSSEIGNLLDERQLIEAVKQLQIFGNIEPTGRLDPATVQLISKPRCGVADTDDTNDGSDPRTNFRSVRSKRYALQGQKWLHLNLTWSLRTRYLKDLDVAAVRHDLGRALNVWSRHSKLTFHEIDSDRADILVYFFRDFHGDGYSFDGKGRILAHAFFPGAGRGGDVHFDEDETWLVNSNEDSMQGTSLFAVAAHEFGHSLGLAHSSVPGALMYPWYHGLRENFDLPQDDRHGIQQMYGSWEETVWDYIPRVQTTTQRSYFSIRTMSTSTSRPVITTPTTTTRKDVFKYEPPKKDHHHHHRKVHHKYGTDERRHRTRGKYPTRYDPGRPRYDPRVRPGVRWNRTDIGAATTAVPFLPIPRTLPPVVPKVNIPDRKYPVFPERTIPDVPRFPWFSSENIPTSSTTEKVVISSPTTTTTTTTERHRSKNHDKSYFHHRAKAVVPDRCNMSYDAISMIRNELFVFKDEYVFRIGDDGLYDGYPAKINRMWSDLPGNLTHIDSVYERPDRRIVFFIGRQYYLYNGNRVEGGYPKPLTHLGLPESIDRVDASLVWSNGRTYLFSGTLFWRIDDDTGKVFLDYPRDISQWQGIGYSIDAAFRWKDDKTYFFKGLGFWKFNDRRMRVEHEQPQLSSSYWMNCDDTSKHKRVNHEKRLPSLVHARRQFITASKSSTVRLCRVYFIFFGVVSILYLI